MKRTMLYRLMATLFVASAILFPGNAAAQVTLACAKRVDIVAFLGDHLSEKLSAVGKLDQSTIVEIYAAEGGNWTLLMSDVSGRSCIILSGDSWESIPVLPKA
ncbi:MULTISPECIES: hypothetical protein [Rhizobium]|uniref:Uncharacterized protein n=1 Tax=Rhizobium tropici TaxID=398 RepID=A0A6P1CDS4_RHITR|nr:MULTISPECIES: hypothetical protein [Rhizobium]AGB70251.1 hypothetical protein RTCIAT899_CH04190 [Rhizobium tropici CIAT 899]MBB4239351.1 hypothetical protein [Rhizobium tropici]MBB5590621.1 hypothetical protein [Rhizobium tropici]MBB6490170.1 hypothetical protein [Rhizobium tropici]NEV14987.1 hypothetical protein [Rhizobium tropici]